MLKRVYWLFGAAVLGLYVVATVRGWEMGSPVQSLVRPDVRRAPNSSPWFGGGYGHGGGFSGGK